MSRSNEEIEKIQKAFIGKTIIEIICDANSMIDFVFSDGSRASLETSHFGAVYDDRPAKIYLED